MECVGTPGMWEGLWEPYGFLQELGISTSSAGEKKKVMFYHITSYLGTVCGRIANAGEPGEGWLPPALQNGMAPLKSGIYLQETLQNTMKFKG